MPRTSFAIAMIAAHCGVAALVPPISEKNGSVGSQPSGASGVKHDVTMTTPPSTEALYETSGVMRPGFDVKPFCHGGRGKRPLGAPPVAAGTSQQSISFQTCSAP